MADFKQWRNENRIFLKDVVPLDAPFNILIASSSLCNAKCIYCAHSQNHGLYEGNMPMELFKKIIRDVQDFPHQIKKIEMHGFGEPLCNPDLAEMIAYARSKNVVEKIDFTTNGLMFTPKRVDKIIAAGVDTIRISLQGLNAMTYKKICGVSMDFDEFVTSLRYLYEHKQTCKICMKIPDIVIKDIPQGQELLENIFGDISDSLFIENVLPMYSTIDYNDIDTTVNEYAIEGRNSIKQNGINKVCHRPFFRLHIAPDGLVTAACCDSTKDVVYGNAYNESIADIWNGSKHQAFLKMQLEGKRFLHPFCKNCMLPNDITSEKDILDPYADDILKRF
jgi:MoaA/NifB/PqqE/SkfB family radical SAM enzyme